MVIENLQERVGRQTFPETVINSPSAEIHVWRLRPENIKQDSAPIILLGGWSISSWAYKDLAQILMLQGREVIFCEYNSHKRYRRTSSLEGEETMVLESIVNNLGLEKVNLLIHSEGALPALDFALKDPEKINSIILMCPAGLIDMPFSELFSRFLANSLWDLVRVFPNRKKLRRAWNAARLAVMGVSRRPIHSIVQAKTLNHLELPIRSIQDNRTKIAIISSEGDMVFPVNQLKTNIEVLGLAEPVLKIIPGRQLRHNDPILSPEVFSQYVGSYLDVFEKVPER